MIIGSRVLLTSDEQLPDNRCADTRPDLTSLPVWLAVLVMLLTGALPLYADDFSITATLTSDYVFRGVSLTDGPALQGSVDYAFDSGLFVGSWTSNYDFDSATNREVDYYIGYSHAVDDDITLSANASRYTFLKEHQIDYNEYNLGLSYRWLDATIWYATDYSGTTGDARYYEIGLNYALPRDVSLAIHAGRSVFDSQAGVNDYSDIIVTARKTFGRFNTEIHLTDTNENQYGDREDMRVFAAIGTTFL